MTRCLSPIDRSAGEGKSSRGMLKRQYSLDRGDQEGNSQKAETSRVHKQNSAGAAHDLEMIEEIPLQVNVNATSPFNKTSGCDFNVIPPHDSLSLH